MGYDVSQIRLLYKGQDNIELGDDKLSYLIKTPMQNVEEGKLFCTSQSDKVIESSYYFIDKNEIGIKLTDYNKLEIITIDPSVSLPLYWATYFGGTSDDIIHANRIDITNNYFYFVGISNSVAFPPLYNNGTSYYTSNFSTTSLSDAFICRTNLSGVIDWCTYIISSAIDGARDVTIDSDGHVYVVGWTHSSTGNAITFPTLQFGSGYLQGVNSSGATPDAFITRFDAARVLQWSTIFGSTTPSNQSDDQIFGVACNSADEVYVVGFLGCNGTGNFPFFNGGGYNNTSYQANNGFIAAFDVSTNQIWASLTANDINYGISIDLNDVVYTVGYSSSSKFTSSSTSSSAYLQSYQGNFDATIIAFNSSTNLVWQTYFGDTDREYGLCCDISEYDRTLYIDGRIESSTTSNSIGFPFANPGSGYYYDTYWPTALTNNIHGYFAQFNTNYSLEWSTLFCGDGEDEVNSISCSDGGNLVISGDDVQQTGSVVFPHYDPGSPWYFDDNATLTYYQPYLAMFSPDTRDILWCTYYGSIATNEYSSDIDIEDVILLWSGWALNNNQTSSLNTLSDVPTSWAQNSSSGTEGIIAAFYNSNMSDLRVSQQQNYFSLLTNQISNNSLIIKATGKNGPQLFNITIIDYLGRTVFSETNVNCSNQCKVDLTDNIGKGLYVLTIQADNYYQAIKFVTY